jgi:magnesium-transporting ATPase (P-type)
LAVAKKDGDGDEYYYYDCDGDDDDDNAAAADDDDDDPSWQRVERDVTVLGERGIRSLAVAKKDGDGPWRMLGLLTFLDPPRPDTKDTIDRAHGYGVDVKMITGDHLLIAKVRMITMMMMWWW